VHDHHRVLLPGLARLFVSNTAPEIHDLHAAVIHAASTAQLSAASKVVSKRFAHRFKAAVDVSFNCYAVQYLDGHNASNCEWKLRGTPKVRVRRSPRASRKSVGTRTLFSVIIWNLVSDAFDAFTRFNRNGRTRMNTH
jgi:hypothetical protein